MRWSLLLILMFILTPITSADSIVPSTNKIYAQDIVSFNITFIFPATIRDVSIDELFNNSIVYSSSSNATWVSNTTYSLTYQLIDKDTDRILVTVYYYQDGLLNTNIQSFFVFVKPFQDTVNWFAVGFVIVCAVLGTFYTAKYIKRRLW
jgi:hypothetical protein